MIRYATVATDPAAAPMTLRVRLVPYDSPARVSDDGLIAYMETWSRGSAIAAADGRMPVFAGHRYGPDGRLEHGPLIGRIAELEDRDDGVYGVFQLADTSTARDVHALADTVGAHVSLEAQPHPDDPGAVDGVAVRTATHPATITGAAVILPPDLPAYPDAAVLATRSAPPEDPAMPTATVTPVDPDPTDPDPVDPDDDDVRLSRSAISEEVRRQVAAIRPAGSAAASASHPLARYGSFDALVGAARELPRDQGAELSRAFHDAYHQFAEIDQLSRRGTIGRALVDQITTDNPGVLPPSWLSNVFGIVSTGRPGITALGGPRSPGPNGMDVYWPYYDGDLMTIVAKQAAEKTEIHSVKVSFKRGQATLQTWAGGSDVSYQLQRRSQPAYMTQYDRILQLSYGMVTEAAFDALLFAGATGTVVYDPAAGDPDGAVLKAALFEASAKVRQATGMPATAVLAASDVFMSIGSQPWLQAPAYGTMNTPGIAQASTLRINVSGLEITEAPGLAAGEMIVTNELAAAWFEDGPFLVTAEDVAKLGTDVAIWGMGQAGLFLPAGVVKAVPAAAQSGRGSSK
jgi:hypothetical protein